MSMFSAQSAQRGRQTANARRTASARGVCYDKNKKKWRAYVKEGGRRLWLGSYETEQDALAAVATWRKP